jgi:hypothetical protein
MNRFLLAVFCCGFSAHCWADPKPHQPDERPSLVAVGDYRASDKAAAHAVTIALNAAKLNFNLTISYGATIVVEEKDVKAALAALRKVRDAEQIRITLINSP